MPFPSVTLNDGNQLPTIAFGTGTSLFGKNASEYVEQAIECGFSHIDTSQTYQNEESVGQGIRESGLKRDELFVTTKYLNGNIQDAVRKSLSKLGLKAVDLYLVHFPASIEKDYEGSWKEFEKIKEDGLAKSIGVSNFTIEQLQIIVKTAKIKPAVNQIRFHPYNYAENKPLLEYAAKHDIVIEGYSTLTPLTRTPNGPVDAAIAPAAKRLGATPVQVLLKWAQNKGVAIVTTSRSKEHLAEYLATADIPNLTAEEIAAIDEAGAKGPPPSMSKKILRAATGGHDGQEYHRKQ